MSYYCEKCRKLYTNDELCPHFKIILKNNPHYLIGIANFTEIACQEKLVSGQLLDNIASQINHVIGTNLQYEGVLQRARDINVFQRLDTEAFVNKGVFRTSDSAKNYLKGATQGQIDALKRKLAGSAQEVDWLRMKQGEFSNIYEKSILLNGNAAGIDGTVVNRLSGKTVERVTIKAAQTNTNIHTNTQQIAEAIKKGTLSPNDTVFGVKGINAELSKTLDREIIHAQDIGNKALETRLQQAKQGLKIIEKNTPQDVTGSTERLLSKISNGQAVTEITGQQIMQSAIQGGIIGAACGLTVSAITSYIRYKNGELTKEEAYRDIGEGIARGIIRGATMGGVMLFLPTGPIGWVAGIGIGLYIDAVTSNILDEIFGKGKYAAILNESGYVLGAALNIETMMNQYAVNIRIIDEILRDDQILSNHISDIQDETDARLSDLERRLNGGE